MIFASYVSPWGFQYFFQYMLFLQGALALCLIALHFSPTALSSRPFRVAAWIPVGIGCWLQFRSGFEGWQIPVALVLLGLILGARNRHHSSLLSTGFWLYPLFILAPAFVGFKETGIHLFHGCNILALLWIWRHHQKSPGFALIFIRNYTHFLLVFASLGHLLITLYSVYRGLGSVTQEAKSYVYLFSMGSSLHLLALQILLFIPLLLFLHPEESSHLQNPGEAP